MNFLRHKFSPREALASRLGIPLVVLGVLLVGGSVPQRYSTDGRDKIFTEEVDVSEGPGVPLKVCRELLPIAPVPRVQGHTTEPLPPPDNCGWSPEGIPNCCPW